MSQFQAINANVEVNGQTVLSIANGMGGMRSLGLRIMSENNIKDPEPGSWHNQQNWLNAFKQISSAIGSKTLFSIGKSIPENAKFPSQIDDIHKALASIDVAYHMNHRLRNTVMFNPATGQMLEGIGHYRYKKISDNVVEILCDNPYPCDFDRGIIEAMARRFKPIHTIVIDELDKTNGCRTKGDRSCLYRISWKL